ncbi:MAG: Txe/YoeB family addiction module toxin [Bergeyella sp.]
MSRQIIFTNGSFEEFVNWSIVNKMNFKKIAELIKHIQRAPFEGIGKPEPLKHNLQRCWSRRITDEHRLVYRINDNNDIEIVSCKGHY